MWGYNPTQNYVLINKKFFTIKEMISPMTVISLCDENVLFCTMISKLCLGYGIFEVNLSACHCEEQ